MKHFLIHLLSLGGLLALSGCEAPFFPPDSGSDPVSVFNEAWTFADEEYSFFAYKGIDWEEVRSRYEPRVQAGMSQEALFDVLAEMLYELRDGHVNLRSSFDLSRNWRWFLDSPPNYDPDLLERSYFREEQQYLGPFVVYDFGDVAYVSYRSFGSSVSNQTMTRLIEAFGGHRGMIFDIRDNGGGSLSNASALARRFTREPVVFGQTRIRNGPNHEDFTEWADERIEPEEGDTAFLKPVILLTNRSSYSAATFFTQMMRELPQVTVLGDTTGGGGGAPADTDLGNGWVLRVSATQLASPSGLNVEDGIPPDTTVWLNPDDVSQGFDTMVEAALARLRR
jgi:hypothetical protein